MNKKEHFLNSIEDFVSDLFYYNWKNDEEFSIDDLRNLIQNKELFLEEITSTFAYHAQNAYNEYEKE